MNAIVRRSLKDGGGLFTTALKGELARLGIDVPFLAHDLISELDGKKSNVDLSRAHVGQSNFLTDREPP